MDRRHLLISLPVIPLVGCASASQKSEFDPATAAREAEAAERAFARSMADRDIAAFAEWIAEDAVFLNGRAPLVGREAIVSFWSRFFEASAAPFAWEPDQVVALEDGSLAWSEGPVTGADGAITLRFQSVWRREPDRRWRVIFDQGHSVCTPANEATNAG